MHYHFVSTGHVFKLYWPHRTSLPHFTVHQQSTLLTTHTAPRRWTRLSFHQLFVHIQGASGQRKRPRPGPIDLSGGGVQQPSVRHSTSSLGERPPCTVATDLAQPRLYRNVLSRHACREHTVIATIIEHDLYRQLTFDHYAAVTGWNDSWRVPGESCKRDDA